MIYDEVCRRRAIELFQSKHFQDPDLMGVKTEIQELKKGECVSCPSAGCKENSGVKFENYSIVPFQKLLNEIHIK
jgi:hypothetical protein